MGSFRLGVFLFFILVGYFASRRCKSPQSIVQWIGFVLGILVIGFVGINTTIISFSQYDIVLSDVLQGIGIGILVGVMIRRKR